MAELQCSSRLEVLGIVEQFSYLNGIILYVCMSKILIHKKVLTTRK